MKQFHLVILVLTLSVTAYSQVAVPNAPGAPPNASVAADHFGHDRQLLQQGKYDEAIAELQQLAASQPETKGLAHELGTAYYRKGDYVHAVDSLKQALQADP
ncbi:MAG TPA: tetratricopeptide repeat protein, partial [Terriglobales bacterium]|nr:tetratricopeptide repeat protein [Terriglobales bacterium]